MKNFKKIMSVMLIFVVTIGFLVACNNEEETQAPPAENVTTSTFTVGTFTATGDGYLGDIVVEVTFAAEEIVSIEIISHEDTAGFADNAFNIIIPNILLAQSTNIDGVTGATYTAQGVLDAVRDAIIQAGANPDALVALVDTSVQESLGNYQADIIVIGGGMSGLTTAISAAQNNASVILLEKMPFLGGSTAFGGGISVAESQIQNALEDGGISIDDLYENWINLQAQDPRGVEFVNPEILRPLVERSGAAFDFLLDLGYEAVVGGNGRMITPVTPEDHRGWGGSFLVQFLEDTARDLGVEIHLDTRGLVLIEEGGAITGVVATGPTGEEVVYLANNAVVLATGGFSRNEELMERFIPELAPFVQFSTAAVGHMGDGFIMAEAAGAVISDDQWLIGLGITNEFAGMVMSVPGILVNHEGNRFVMETRPFGGFIDHYTFMFNHTAAHSPNGSFFVFDSSDVFEHRINQVEDNLDNASAFKADTIQELAELMQVPYEALLASINQINAVYNEEIEDPFGRTFGINPLLEAPFYAMRLYPMDMGTIGGVQTNEYSQVLDANGAIIQGLFAVGEMSNQRYIGSMYFSGLSLMVALQQGIAAGIAAAR